MATTGNVRISELTTLGTVNGGEVLPVSSVVEGNYKTQKIDINAIKEYIDSTLNVTDTKTDVNNIKVGLGQTEKGDLIDVDYEIATYNAAIVSTGQGSDGTVNRVSFRNYMITKPISVKAGRLYIVKYVDNVHTSTIPAASSQIVININTSEKVGISVFSKPHTYIEYTVEGYTTTTAADGTTVTVPNYKTEEKTWYETLPHHYIDDNNKITPTWAGYVIYLAPEDGEIVVSMPQLTEPNNSIWSVGYAAIMETADRYIGANTDDARVIVEALASLSARIESCEKNIGTIHDAIVNELDALKMYKYRGGPLITNSIEEAPNHEGQIAVVNNIAYIALKAGDKNSWTQITN